MPEEGMKSRIVIVVSLIAFMIIIVPANGAIFEWLGIETSAHGMCIDDAISTHSPEIFSSSLVDVEPMTGMDDMDCPVHPRVNITPSLDMGVQ
jgi:hypothetical protein